MKTDGEAGVMLLLQGGQPPPEAGRLARMDPSPEMSRGGVACMPADLGLTTSS